MLEVEATPRHAEEEEAVAAARTRDTGWLNEEFRAEGAYLVAVLHAQTAPLSGVQHVLRERESARRARL